MIQEGNMTMIDDLGYVCEKVVNGMAYFKSISGERRGRYKKMEAKYAPYFDEKGEYIVPEKPKFSRKRMTRFHFLKIIKDETDLSLSHDLAYFVAEWLEDIVRSAASAADYNALERGDDKITAAHWPPNKDLGNQYGYWESNREWAKDYKQYLRENNE